MLKNTESPLHMVKPEVNAILNNFKNNSIIDGLDGAVARLEGCIEEGLAAIPDCQGRDMLVQIVKHQAKRFFPAGIRGRSAA